MWRCNKKQSVVLPLPGKIMQTIYFSIRISTRIHHLGWSVQISHLCNWKKYWKSFGSKQDNQVSLQLISPIHLGVLERILLFNNHLDVLPPIGWLALTRNIPKCWFKTFFPVCYVTSTRRLWHVYRLYRWHANKKHTHIYVFSSRAE